MDVKNYFYQIIINTIQNLLKTLWTRKFFSKSLIENKLSVGYNEMSFDKKDGACANN